MPHTIRIRKGVDIRLAGAPSGAVRDAAPADVYAVQPPDFHGLVPRVAVKPGDRVAAGTTLFTDKTFERIAVTSPVSGTVRDVVRGEKRRVLSVEVTPDGAGTSHDFGALDPATADRGALLDRLLDSGCFAFIRTRPFDVVPDPTVVPRDIFISGYFSAPLAPSVAEVMAGRMDDFAAGAAALGRLSSSGRVHVGVRTGDSTFDAVPGIERTSFDGPHPAGNVGVQLHHVAPLAPGETVWTLHPEDVANFGRVLRTGHYVPTRVVGAGGSEHPAPGHLRTLVGARITTLTGGAAPSPDVRIISGDVLTGTRVGADGFLGAFAHAVTLLPEGKAPKFLLTSGWLGAGFDKFSVSRAFPTWLMPRTKTWKLDTNTNGEERALVVTGQYEQVFPFDLFPQQLVKSIIAHDLDGMERLGILEVAPEDFALCEYVCTSKLAVQSIVRKGLDTVKQEIG